MTTAARRMATIGALLNTKRGTQNVVNSAKSRLTGAKPKKRQKMVDTAIINGFGGTKRRKKK